jgi:hypothetical protein
MADKETGSDKSTEIKTTLDLNAEESLGDLEIILSDDGSATIELGDKESGAGKDTPSPEDRRKRQGRFSARLKEKDEKIRQESARAQEAETMAERLLRENKELAAKLATADAAALTHFEAATTANLEQAKKKLKEARENGDLQAETDAVAEVGRYSAEKARLESWKAQQTKEEPRDGADNDDDAPPPKPDATKRKPTQAEIEANFSPELKAFIGDNPWFRPNTPEFDLDMHTAAVNYGAILDTQLRRQGREDEIGTAGYYKQVAEFVRKQFPDDDADEDVPPPVRRSGLPKMNRDEGVLPARSESMPNGDGRPVTPERIRLSADEQEFARSMAEQGAPGYVHPDGRHFTPQEAYVRFAKAIAADRNIQAQKRRA